MRILILSQFFAPEPNLKGLRFARELRRRGHEVEVLTGFPNYPGGRLYPGYRVRPWRREIIDGITVNRVALYPSHDKSAVRRVANYASFALSATVLGPLLTKKPDIVYVYHPPGTVGLPAMALKALHGCPLVYDIQDLWPDSVTSSGMMSNRWLTKILDRWCRLIYSRVDRIVVLSPGFRDTLIQRGVSAKKIDVIYNWTDETPPQGIRCDDNRRRELGLAGRFNIVFAGTMGLVQKLDVVLEAARICAATVPDAQFVFVGGGVDKSRLEQRAAKMQLPNTLFLPRQPMEAIGAILSMADVLLVHLQDDPLFHITIPSKTQAYLAAGRPILMAVAGDAAELVTRAGAGLTCPPENAAAMAAAVKRLREHDPAELDAMGADGKSFYDDHLSLRVGAEKFERVFRAVLSDTSAASEGPNSPTGMISSSIDLPECRAA